MRQPLSSQAQASLALLEGEHRNESFGEEKSPSQVGSETNAHLPFVMDSFGATRRSKLRVNVDPSVLQRALAQAELAETLVVSPITSDEKVADPIVIHPDVPDEVMVEPQPIDAAPAEPLAVVEPEVAVEVIEETPTLSAEPELPAVVGGIPAEEVAQREAEQFAKGLAQAQEEAATQLAEAIEKAMAEGLAKGLEQGKAEGLEEGQRLGLEQGLEQGKEQGLKEGEQAAREAVAEEMAAQRVLFENASNELNGLMADPKKFFEPRPHRRLDDRGHLATNQTQVRAQGVPRHHHTRRDRGPQRPRRRPTPDAWG